VNFQQLRSVRETVRKGFNLTLVAEALHTSQPGVSRQLKELEDELGVQLFVRAGRRFLGLTPPGEVMLPIIEGLLREADNLKDAGEEFAQADHGIATEALADYPELVTLPSYRWTHVVVVQPAHPLALGLAQGQQLTLARLAQFPLITYETGFTGRSHIDEAFSREGLLSDIVLQAMDAAVIKTYVELGIGVGVIGSVAFDDERDRHLVAVDARHLFATNTTRVAVKRGAYLRGYVYDFIQTFAPTLTRLEVQAAVADASATPAR
jgi:LysR family cys regulon transcriptional activator